MTVTTYNFYLSRYEQSIRVLGVVDFVRWKEVLLAKTTHARRTPSTCMEHGFMLHGFVHRGSHFHSDRLAGDQPDLQIARTRIPNTVVA